MGRRCETPVIDPRVVVAYMFGPEREQPCQMCTPLLDGLDAVADHIAQRASLVIVAESPLARLLGFARERGWRDLRLVSTAGNSYNRDYHGKTARGATRPCSTCFAARAARSATSGARR